MVEIKLTLPYGYTDADVCTAVAENLPVDAGELLSYEILWRKLDTSEKPPRSYLCRIALSFSPEREAGLLKMRKRVKPYEPFSFRVARKKSTTRPVVVGAGPAGLFCALILAEAGLSPILIERGLPVEERVKSVERFRITRRPDPESNIQFGEGGAGTFSDGKLKCGKRDADGWKVLSTLVALGAPDDILISDAPHLGTDRLYTIMQNMRRHLQSLGVEICFSTRLVGITHEGGTLRYVSVEREGREERLFTDTLFLATGHSAEDTFRLLHSVGVAMEQRPFGIGVRIEHPQSLVDEWAYGKNPPKELPAASYRFVTHLPSGRSVYSFCMCPGGTVVAAASADGRLVTNGMSNSARDGKNANAAFLVSVTPEDFGSNHPLAGIEYQKRIERAAFASGGEDFTAPVCRMEDFMNGRESTSLGCVAPTYPLGYRFASPDAYLPVELCSSLRAAITDFDLWQSGFYFPDAILTGAETRSTSPIRIPRDESGESVTHRGIYPVGEGAGYAGGIVSSAIDGVRAALKFLKE